MRKFENDELRIVLSKRSQLIIGLEKLTEQSRRISKKLGISRVLSELDEDGNVKYMYTDILDEADKDEMSKITNQNESVVARLSSE